MVDGMDGSGFPAFFEHRDTQGKSRVDTAPTPERARHRVDSQVTVCGGKRKRGLLDDNEDEPNHIDSAGDHLPHASPALHSKRPCASFELRSADPCDSVDKLARRLFVGSNWSRRAKAVPQSQLELPPPRVPMPNIPFPTRYTARYPEGPSRGDMHPHTFRYVRNLPQLMALGRRQSDILRLGNLSHTSVVVGVIRQRGNINAFPENIVTGSLNSAGGDTVDFRVHAADIHLNLLPPWSGRTGANVSSISLAGISAQGYLFPPFSWMTSEQTNALFRYIGRNDKCPRLFDDTSRL